MAMKLEGGERLVLKNLLDLQGDSGENVEDTKVAAATKMAVQDVRDWLETLEAKEFVERTRLTDRFSAYVTAKGKQALRMTEPIPSPKVAGEGATVVFPPGSMLVATSSEGRAIDPKDRRVAVRFRSALTPLYFVLHRLSEECGVVNELVALCAEKQLNTTLHPQDPRAIEAILSVLSKTSLNGPSDLLVEGPQISCGGPYQSVGKVPRGMWSPHRSFRRPGRVTDLCHGADESTGLVLEIPTGG